jgi:PAS domain S-box-containing protein
LRAYSSQAVTGAVLVLRDITSEYEARVALRRSEKLFRTLVQASPLAIISLTPEGRVTSWNEAAEKMYGWRSDEVTGGPLPAIPLDSREQCAAIRQRVAFGEAFHNFETVRRRKDGSLIDVSLSAASFQNDAGQLEGIITISADITDHKRAEEALSDREAKLRTIFDATSVGIGLAVDRVLQEVNDALCRITGYSREELLGRDARMLYGSEEDYEHVGREIQRQITACGTTTLETRWRGKDGALREIVLGTTPIDATDHAKGRIFTALDITERKQAERALRESEDFLGKSQEAARVGSYCFDARTGCWISSPTLDEIAGVDGSYPKTVEGWIDFVHPDHKEEMLRYLNEHVSHLAGHHRKKARAGGKSEARIPARAGTKDGIHRAPGRGRGP